MKNLINSIYLLFCTAISSFAQEGYPTPAINPKFLFYIQHSEGHNTYVYEANMIDKLNFDNKNPIKNYRILYDKNGEIRPLTGIQQKFAYGIKSKELENNTFEIKIVSYANQPLYLKIDKTGKPYVETVVNGHKLNLQRIFLKQKEGTSGLGTQVEYLLFYGTDHYGKKVHEKLIP
ncbi:DUF4833 domain-containing protein [Sphingobacterium faecium]|uniref:DUF4833 domain-containing protein n=1 Tax=Sphingobacterium faecium TaxID=34087 RepID=UPI002468E12C|nr:DUF4833 domain-containing protein [Sphingobacterium faecium]MDH5828261.1 DUF4833 domain-containing protein [Sphingobacterium faecium]